MADPDAAGDIGGEKVVAVDHGVADGLKAGNRSPTLVVRGGRGGHVDA